VAFTVRAAVAAYHSGSNPKSMGVAGVIADVEYWDDAALMDGHWTADSVAFLPPDS
jgi:hypothetical protein